ncbi:lasso peptide isopeptide bond-forming cyclase [Leptothoe spongobia]|uniref:asparagine synthase (glutamine-hydrolyzing) n=1 Tax=Leptothoe spongobia TAU-MAC 1115 TaxID=1967444 RepID=A0A947DD51_9CYAN|nr:lasso peptide isopeptide bond-forming cyclase [Leptothoe spongobia]MBT9314730.1 lasso peptide isopeptide bond-forming cyclase [Leptothoe spongobia TAU-MAC 1115]
MSGIAGIYHFDQRPVVPSELYQMINTLAHRGPDGSDTWCQDSIGLGHRMLWTTPESLHEQLPLVKGDLAITADARIDNRDELAQVLPLPDRPLEKITDSEFILAAYEQWGSDCPEHLLGAFAFVMWDRQKQQLFCARDHFGVKPFYYYHQPNLSFAVASEIKGLLCLDWIPQKINEIRIADYLSLMLDDKVITTFEDILRLPPASRMWVNASGLKIDTYWQLDPDKELTLESDEAYAEAFREIFTKAVRCRLRSAFSVGSHLSGGLDSSSVSCVARKILSETTGETLHTFSNIFDTVKECDERPYIVEVLKQGGYTPHYIHADLFGPLSDVDQIWNYEDEPILGPSHHYPWRLNQAANEANVRIVFDGFDGDTVVSHGLDRLHELAFQQKWPEFSEALEIASENYKSPVNHMLAYYGLPALRQLSKRGQWLAFAKTVNYIHHRFQYSRRSLLIRQGIKPVFNKILQKFYRVSEKPVDDLVKVGKTVNANFAKQIYLKERIDKYTPKPIAPGAVRRKHWQSLTEGVLSVNLEAVDRCAAAFGLEARHPFLDRRLVEFCLAVPSDQKFRRGFGRIIMRQGLNNILPKAVQWRGDKANMTANFVNGLLNINHPLFEQVLNQYHHSVLGYVNLDNWKNAWKRVKQYPESNKTANSMTNDCFIVWRATVLALWFKRI